MRRAPRLRRAALAVLALVAAALAQRSAAAHDPGLSSAEVRLHLGGIEARLVFARRDLEVLAGGGTPAAALAALAPEALELSLGGDRLPGRLISSGPGAGETLEARVGFAAGHGRRLVLHSALLAELPRGHRQLLQVFSTRNERLLETVLDAARAEAVVDLAGEPVRPTLGGLFLLGVEHILTGYDHLLFLLGLLLACRGLRPLLATITAFSAAHSITLALSVLDLAPLTPRVAEPLIALSVAWVGLENLLRRSPGRRWPLAFGFGLIHGFGFASALRELGLGSGWAVAAPLVAFNLGVEAGQLLVALPALVLISALARRPIPCRRFVKLASAAVAAAGALWLLDRLAGV